MAVSSRVEWVLAQLANIVIHWGLTYRGRA